MMRRSMRLSVFKPKSRKVKDSVSTTVFIQATVTDGMCWTSTTSITRKGGFDLSGMLYGKKGYKEDRKTITQKTLLDETWIQDSYLCTQYDMKDVSAMLSLNYQFNENHSLGARYDYNRRLNVMKR